MMMMTSQKTALITGITGQDGSYLAELLLKKDYKVVGLISKKYNIGWQNIEHIKKELILEDGDLLDQSSLKKVLKKHHPDEIYNLAGLTFIPKTWDEPTLTLNINALGVSRLLELLVADFSKTKLFQASSARIFGQPRTSPQSETTIISPQDPYSISKAAAHVLVQVYRQKHSLFVVNGILYNHESQRRGKDFVTKKITSTAAKIKLGLSKKLELGNLDAQQDWGYAPDYVKAMWLMLQHKNPQDYILATGKLHSVRDICQIAFSHLDLNYKNFVTMNHKFYRSSSPQVLVGNPAKAKESLNWQPKTSFKNMIIKMVDHDISQLKNHS